MSRRLRLEKEYAKQLQQEVDEEENRIKKLHEKIFGPIVWASLEDGYHIQDLQEKYYRRVIDLIHTYYLPNEVLASNTCLSEDKTSLKSFTSITNFVIKDSTSIIAVDEKNDDELVGVLLMNVVNLKTYDSTFNRLIHGEGEANQKCIAIQNALLKEHNVFQLYKCEKYIRYHLLCIKDEYRHKGIGYQLMNVGIKVAISLNIPVICGIFTSLSFQQAAEKVGFQLIQQISYTNWRDVNKEIIFSDPGPGNYTCAFMVKVVPLSKKCGSLNKLATLDAKEVESSRTKSEKSITSTNK